MNHASATVAALLRRHGFRVTKPREKTLAALMRAREPLSVEALSRMVPEVHMVTLYRMLAAFRAAGLVYQTHLGDGGSRFEYQPKHHHHLTCTRCGRSTPVSICVEEHYPELLRENAFAEIDNHVLEFFGVCTPCDTHGVG